MINSYKVLLKEKNINNKKILMIKIKKILLL